MSAPMAAGRLSCEVVVPVRWEEPDPWLAEDFRRYLARVAQWCDVTVVDGSTDPSAGSRWTSWPASVRVLRPDSCWGSANGKVVGAMTGVAAARHDRVVIADDDVRYDLPLLTALHDALDEADVVLPDNYPTTVTWWSWWECGRVLLNRALGQDWPGTAGLRRETVMRMGGWSADVLFENAEMARTVRAAGGRVVHRADLLVPRHPPSRRHFARQRLRQAYEDQASALRLVAQLAVLPFLLWARRRRGLVAAAAVGAVSVAEVGRRRAGGAAVFPSSAALAAPLWLLERGVCSWLGLLVRARGGPRYHGRRICVAAHSPRWLESRLRSREARELALAVTALDSID